MTALPSNESLAEIMEQLAHNMPPDQLANVQSQVNANGSAQSFPSQQAQGGSAGQQSNYQQHPAATLGQNRPPSHHSQTQQRPSPYALPPSSFNNQSQQSTPLAAQRRPAVRPPNSFRPPPPPSAGPSYTTTPGPVDPHAYYVFPTPLPIQPFPSGGQPLPLFPTISTNRQRNAQASHTTYPSRLRTGVSTLMQPIIPFTATAVAAKTQGTRTGGRGRAVNYAELDGDVNDSDDEESSSESSSEDEEKPEVETNYGGKRVPVAVRMGRSGSRRDSGTPGEDSKEGGKKGKNKGPTDKSYLGEIPPGDKVVIKPMAKTKHEYHTEAQLDAAASQKTILIPIRIDFDTDTHRIRDAFTWNLNETLLTPLQFAKIFCHDLELPHATHAETIASQIKTQLEEFAAVAEMNVGYEDNVSGGSGPVFEPSQKRKASQQPEDVDRLARKRAREREETIVEEDEDEGGAGGTTTGANTTTVGTPAPGTGVETPAGEEMDGVEGAEEGDAPDEEQQEEEVVEERRIERIEMESDCRIIVNLDVQIATHNLRDRIEWDLSSPLLPEDFAALLCADLGLSGESVPLVSHAIHEELLKHKKDAIEMGLVGAGWRDVQAGSSRAGPRKLVGVWRGFEEQEDFAPVLLELTSEDIEKREIERERASRRARRDTARFTTGAGARFRGSRR